MLAPQKPPTRKTPTRKTPTRKTPTRKTPTREAVLPSPAEAQDFSRRLRSWFRKNSRELPWRRTRNAYHVLVSELMLQQTQVSRVLDFYAGFIARFPDLETLALARPARVMEQWQGLGYYARARNLHALARRVVRDGPGTARGATLPAEPAELRSLPGVGAYTAGAVASFAYEKRAALVDTNVARVLQRYFAPRLHPRRARDLTRLWALAKAILPRTGKAVWTHNQALMELGALVCTARVAHCGRCPVRANCQTANRNSDDGIGIRTRKPKRKAE